MDVPDDLFCARWGGGGAGVPVVLAGVPLDVLWVEYSQWNVGFFVLTACLLPQISQLFFNLPITTKKCLVNKLEEKKKGDQIGFNMA